MDIAEHIEHLRRDGARLVEAAGRAGLDAPVPTCPGWTVRDLVGHTGGVHRWAASHLTTGRPGPATAEETAPLFATPEDGKLLDWYRDAHSELVDALTKTDPGVACWSFLAAPSPLAFWARRQAHETAIHRVDAESAGSSVTPVAPGFAVDGIDELLNGFLSRPTSRLVADPGGAGRAPHRRPGKRPVPAAVEPPRHRRARHRRRPGRAGRVARQGDGGVAMTVRWR